VLTLLAYGRANAYLSTGAHTEFGLLQQSTSGQTPRDLARARAPMDRDAYARTIANHGALVASIPAPGVEQDDWCLALSQGVIDRVVRRIGQLRDTQQLDLDAEIVARAVSEHVARWIPDRWRSVPDYTDTGCIDSNVSIHTALRIGALLVVTKLDAACGPTGRQMYDPVDADQDYPLGVTQAVHLDQLVDAFCQKFDFHAIDASVLERIAPSGPPHKDF
jgi:hypothetical protein